MWWDKDIILFQSHGDRKVKYSYHIYVDNYFHLNNTEAKIFYNMVFGLIPEQYHQFIDSSVYSKTQQFRLIGSQKEGSNRPKTPIFEYILNDKDYYYNVYQKWDHPMNKHFEFFINSLVSVSPHKSYTYVPIPVEVKIKKTPTIIRANNNIRSMK